MTVSQELVWLINQIRNTPSPRERLRLLALGWRTLRGLSTADRLAIAREIGFEGAEQLVEQLARRGGASPSLLLQGLESLESADPEMVAGLVQGLTDPDRRADTAERLMDAAAECLSEEAVIVDAVAPLDPSGAGEPLDFEASAAKVQPPPLPPPPEVVEAVVTTDVATDEEPLVDEIDVGEEDAAVVDESAPTVEQLGVPDATPVPTERKQIPAPVIEVPQDPPEMEPITPAVQVESAVATLAAATPLTSRFRVLAELAVTLEGAGARMLVAVIETFPAGWARRRAIETLLRAGIPRAIEDGLELVSTLERPSERMWALSTLASSRELDEDEREEIVAAAGSPSIERRLRRRLACRGMRG